MRVAARSVLAGLLTIGALLTWTLALSLSAARAAAPFGIERFVAVNCSEGHENCAEELLAGVYSYPKEPTQAEAEAGGYTQAAGHVPYGITHFKVTTEGSFPNEKPTGVVTHIRTDVAPGLSTNPTAVPQCSMGEFGSTEALPGSGLYPAPSCNSNTRIGVNKVVVYVEGATPKDVPMGGAVYNLVQGEGLASEFGVALELPKALTEAELFAIFKGSNPAVEKAQYFAHTLIEGHIEWGSQAAGTGAGDYHDYFEINVSPALPLISSRLIFFGRSGEGDFVTNPTNCAGNTTNTLTMLASTGSARRTYTPPVGVSGCGLVPFEPGFSLTPETKQSDQPDGITTKLTIPHNPAPTALDDSQLMTATVTLPEGMTLNPAAGQGLQACTPAQARIHSETPGMACPAASEIGTLALEVPDLPPGSLTGKVYLGGPETGPITGPPYVVYLDAESARYGISVRVKGEATPNEATGRLTTVFPRNPEQPFSDATLKFKGGALAPLANPLLCGAAKTETSLVPYTGTSTKSPFSEFVVDSNNAGGACGTLPFALGQSTEDHPTTGAANTNFTLNLARTDGQQYLSKVSAALPEGLVGKIPAVPLCAEPEAAHGTCAAASQIGTATVTAGSGPTPAHFSGPVYLTGPTGKAPYGMTVVIHAAVGPFDLGPVVVRAAIEVNSLTARVTVTSQLPTIVKGIPIRLKTLSVAINRQGFLINPTNCGTLATETTLTSTLGATRTLATPFQATGCSSLPFKPKLGASTSAKASKAKGASLVVKIGYPTGVQANIKSVVAQLPKQLPSRLSTLNKACTEAQFNANPSACPVGSKVGRVKVTTPVLPGQLTGTAYFVSHGGAAFPDLDLVLIGPNGLTILLVGNTKISKGVTTTTFAAIPDVPVSSFELKLPAGRYSALSPNGDLCAKRLYMPTTITAQNGAVIKQRTRISVSGCGVEILSHRTRHHRAIITAHVPSAGRLSGSGRNLRIVYERVRKAGRARISVALSHGGEAALARHHHLKVRLRVGFIASKGGASHAFVTVLFR